MGININIMNRQQAKELLPIIQAFAEGKTIQVKGPDNRWYDYSGSRKLKFDSDPKKYRIKPEPKYRPFVDKEECWQEMLKHQPFGWIKYKEVTKSLIIEVSSIGIKADKIYYFQEAEEVFTFADSTPFGIKDK